MGLVDNHTRETHPLKHQGVIGKILPSVNLKVAQFGSFWDDASDYAGATRKSNACKAVTP
jgi:hypothetical protein